MKKKKPKGYISYLGIICIIGIIILLFGNSISDKDTENTKQSEVQIERSGIDESRLENILSQIKGVGEADVMITYENSGTANYLADTTYESKNDTKTDTKKTQKIVMASGSPVMYENSLPKVKGVVVVCDGAGKSSVKNDIVNAVCAVTGVYEHNVAVFERK